MKKEVKDSNIDTKNVNEVVSLASKILKVLYIVLIVGIILIGTLLIKEWGILTFILTILKVASPFFIGFVIAWLFNPFVVKLSSKGLDRILSTIIVYVIFLGVLFLFISTLFPTLFKQVNEFIKVIPNLLTSLEGFINNIFDKLDNNDLFDVNSVKENIISVVYNTGTGIANDLPQTIMNLIGSIFSGVGTVAMSLVIGFYMLFDFDGISSHLLKLLPKRHRFEVSHLLIKIGSVLRKSVNGTLSCAALIFICASIGFALVGLDAPMLFGAFCGITDLIPYVGPFIGGAAAVIVGFSQSPTTGVLCLIVVFITQILENFFIQPLVMSKTTKIHPVTIIISLIIFGHFFGIVGMILATPVISVAKVLFRYIVEKFDLFDYPEYELEEEEKA